MRAAAAILSMRTSNYEQFQSMELPAAKFIIQGRVPQTFILRVSVQCSGNQSELLQPSFSS
jgi:hypothetical protein